jgi:Flp pilus assembly protein TadG
MRRLALLHRRRKDGDRGAAIVEFALMLPVLTALVLGIFEYGMAWHDTAAVERAVQNAGRVGASQGDSRHADYEALRAVESSLQSAERLEVVKVVIFRSTDANGVVPTACRDYNVSGLTVGSFGINSGGVQCNVYTNTQVQSSGQSGFPLATCTGAWDQQWCPLNRDNTRPSSDFLGVYLEVRYESMTGLLPNTITIKRSSIYLLEPEAVGT